MLIDQTIIIIHKVIKIIK